MTSVTWQPPPPGLTPPWCDFFWGSHGCDLPYEHEAEAFGSPAALVHRCGPADDPCSWFDEAAPPDRRWRPADADSQPGEPHYWYDAGFRFAYWASWSRDSTNWRSCDART